MMNGEVCRSGGVLLGINSLPGKFGIGKLGCEAREFVDILVKAKQRYWQVLPLSPTGFGDSPYQSFSTRAGNPYFIDFESLESEGLLKHADYADIDFGGSESDIDYGRIYETVFKVLHAAFERFQPDSDADYVKFIDNNREWVEGYAIFMALKNAHGGAPWYEWEEDLKLACPDAVARAKEMYSDEYRFQMFLQYEFYKQWLSLKNYANSRGIEIIGDMPIYCAYDSVEVWLTSELFELNPDRSPKNVAGCPPDAYAVEGQLWGNPIYNWPLMESTGYKWWIDRIAFETDIFDVLRIDHFRAFASYYSIPAGSKNAVNGRWLEGPGMKLFNSTNYWLGKKRIIAEDLGHITEDVAVLLKNAGYPGMKVLQFAFDPGSGSKYLPCNFDTPECVVYASTHDSDTTLGWAEKLEGQELKLCMKYLDVSKRTEIPYAMLRLAWSSIAEIAIAQPQDILELGNEARINTPSTVGKNWRWRITKKQLSSSFVSKLCELSEIYNRVNPLLKPEKPEAACEQKCSDLLDGAKHAVNNT